MSKQSQAQYLEESFRGIRDEYRLHANTALRIGTALLDLLRFAQLGEFDEITFNKVLNHPTFLKGLTTLGSIIFGEYAEGLKGGIITKDGVAELKDLWVREHAKLGDGTTHYDESGKVLPALEVKGDSTFTGNLSSPEFISEFLGGLGWAIQKKEFVNAAGETEIKYTLEIDNAVIRNTLRVFEMIVSQLLGENANRVFSDMMVVDHYDKRTGKVMLKTQDGQLYNSLRSGDYIEVQQYNGDPNTVNDWYVTKAYEFRVKEVGVGNLSDGKDRLDWLTFENFTSQIEGLTPEKAFKEGDTLVRVDSERSDRKGVITIMAVGENTPYMDVLYGKKTDPSHALKGRIGNLEGIRSDVFGWLEGFGAYLNNLYAVGKFFDYQTGENLKARVEMTLSRFRSFYSETTYNVSDSDNFLKNGFFQQALDYWTPCDLNGNTVNVNQAVEAVGTGGQPLLFNGVAINTSRQSLAEIKEVDGIQVLYLRNMGVSQNFADIKRNGWHEEFDTDDDTGLQTMLVADQLFMGIRIMPITSGRLSVRFKQAGNAVSGWVRDIESSIDWQLYQVSDSVADPWEYPGTGKLIISYTGECYIRFVTLQSDPIVNSRLTYSTLIEQNSRRITIEASRQDENLLSAVAQINIEFDNITTTVTNNKSAADAAFQSIISDLDEEVQAREDLEDTYKATWVYQHDDLLALMAAEFDAEGKILGYADLKVQVDSIDAEVVSISDDLSSVTARVGDLEVTDTEITARVSSVEIKASNNETNIGSLDGRLSTAEDDIESAQSDIVSLTTRVGELEVTDTEITARVSSVEIKASTNETNIGGLDGRLSTAEDNIGFAQSDLVSLTMRVGELEVTDSEITARVYSVETMAGRNYTNIGDLDGRLSTAEDDIESAQSDINYVTTSVSELQILVDSISTTVTDNKSAADQAFRNINENVIPGLVNDISSVDTKARNAASAASSAATAAANAQSTADSAASTAGSAATWINQNKGTLSAVAGRFDGNGHLSELSGYVATSNFSSLFSQSFNNSGAITSSSISTYISSFVDAAGVRQLISEATIKADKINFKTGTFSITNSSGQTTLALDSNGNLTVSGTISGNSVFRYGSGDGIRLTDHGLERWNASANSWVALYAGRYVKFVSNSYVTLNKEDDFVVSLSGNIRIYLPSGCTNGKIITIKTIGHTTNLQPSSGNSIFTDHTISYGGGGTDLNNWDRAEFVLYNNVWYWNAMPI